jgi:hypothetical protein
LRAEVLGEIRHRRDVGLAALVQPLHDLTGTERLAAQLADERLQLRAFGRPNKLTGWSVSAVI